MNLGVIGRQSDSTATVEVLLTPKSIQHVQVLIGFVNIYRRFIRKCTEVKQPLTELLRTIKIVCTVKALQMTSEKPKIPPPRMEWTQEIKEVFWKFKKTFYDALILQQFNPANPNILQGDTRAYTFTAILYQYDGLGTLRPVYFYSPQCYPATQNYDTDDKALFKIVDTMKQW